MADNIDCLIAERYDSTQSYLQDLSHLIKLIEEIVVSMTFQLMFPEFN